MENGKVMEKLSCRRKSFFLSCGPKKKEYEEKKKQQREKNPSAQVSQETEDAKIKD